MLDLFFGQSIAGKKLVVDLAVVSALTFICAFVSRKILALIQRSSAPSWLLSLVDSFIKPAPFIILGYGTFFFLEILTRAYPLYLKPSIFAQAKYLFLVGTLTYLVLKWKKTFADKFTERLKSSTNPLLDPSAVYPLSKILSILILVVATLAGLDIIGVPVSTLLAFGGIGGLAISWAAKDVIANFFGGLMIYINRPFLAGDWIKSPNKNFEGVVEEIGWYRTQIRSFERRPTYIPNSMITDAIIENPGRMYNRRIKMDIGLRYEDLGKLKAIIADIEHILSEHPDLDRSQSQLVHFVRFGAYSLDINIYTFTRTTQWSEFRRVQQEIFFKIAQAVHSRGGDFAFPTQTLQMSKEPQS